MNASRQSVCVAGFQFAPVLPATPLLRRRRRRRCRCGCRPSRSVRFVPNTISGGASGKLATFKMLTTNQTLICPGGALCTRRGDGEQLARSKRTETSNVDPSEVVTRRSIGAAVGVVGTTPPGGPAQAGGATSTRILGPLAGLLVHPAATNEISNTPSRTRPLMSPSCSTMNTKTTNRRE